MSMINKTISDITILNPRMTARRIPLGPEETCPIRNLNVVSLIRYVFYPPYKLLRRPEPSQNCVVIIPLEGEKKIQTTEFSTVIKPGEMAIVPTSVSRQIEMVNCDRYEGIHLRVAPSIDAPSPLWSNRVIATSIFNLDAIIHAFEGLYAVSQQENGNDTVRHHFASALADLLKQNTRHRKPDYQDANKQRLIKLWFEVRKNASHPWTVHDLARLAGLSVMQFYRMMDAHYQTRPMEMVQRIRLDLAKALLTETDLTLDRIGDACGYANGFSLSKAFVRVEKIRPGIYRRRKRVRDPDH